MKLEQLKSFCAFVENHNSLREAERETGTTRLIIKKHIQSLELSLGKKLFYSRKKSLFPTPDALLLYKQIKSPSESIENIIENFKKDRKNIRLSCTYSFLSAWMPSFLDDFIEQNDTLEIFAIDKPIDLVTEGHDLFIGCKTEEIGQNKITRIPLCNFHMSMWASRKYMEKYGLPKTKNDIKEHKFLAYTENKHLHTFENQSFFNNILKDCDKVRTFSSGYNVLQAIKQGYGIGPTSIEVAMAQTEELIPVLLENLLPQIVEVFIFVQNQTEDIPDIQKAIFTIKNSTNKYLKQFDERYEKLTGIKINREIN